LNRGEKVAVKIAWLKNIGAITDRFGMI